MRSGPRSEASRPSGSPRPESSGRARLAADPTYTGETWEIAARDLDSADTALVTITAGPAPGEPKRRIVRAQADYPRDPPRRARHTKVDEFPGSG